MDIKEEIENCKITGGGGRSEVNVVKLIFRDVAPPSFNEMAPVSEFTENNDSNNNAFEARPVEIFAMARFTCDANRSLSSHSPFEMLKDVSA